MFNGIQSKRWY